MGAGREREWAKDMSKHLTTLEMANKHIISHQRNAKQNHSKIPARMAKIRKISNTKCQLGWRETGILKSYWQELKIVQPLGDLKNIPTI